MQCGRAWRLLALYTLLYTSRACVDWIEHPLHAAGARRNEAAARLSSAVRCCVRGAAVGTIAMRAVATSVMPSQLEIILGAGHSLSVDYV